MMMKVYRGLCSNNINHIRYRFQKAFQSTAVIANNNTNDDNIKQSINVITTPGCRTIELCKSLINQECVMKISNRLETYKNNEIVQAVIIASQSDDFFSDGIDEDDLTLRGKSLLLDYNNLIQMIDNYNKPIISVLGGNLNGSGLGIFAASKYKLMTSKTRFILNELERGYLPIGLAYYIVRGCDEGKALARYIGLSQIEICGVDLHAIGMADYLVENHPHVALRDALSLSLSPGLGTKYKQDHNIDIDSLQEMLSDMHFETDLDDVYNHEIWDKLLLVTPNEAQDDYNNGKDSGNNNDDEDENDLRNIINHITDIFNSSTYNEDEIINKLETINSNWSNNMINIIRNKKIDNSVIDAWYEITNIAYDKSLKETLEIEMELNEKLLPHRL